MEKNLVKSAFYCKKHFCYKNTPYHLLVYMLPSLCYHYEITMLLLCDSYPLLIYPMQHRYHSDTTLNVLLTFTQKHSLGILGKLGILVSCPEISRH